MTPEVQLSLAGVTHRVFFRAVPQTNLATGKSSPTWSNRNARSPGLNNDVTTVKAEMRRL
jgi:hypothetical protein